MKLSTPLNMRCGISIGRKSRLKIPIAPAMPITKAIGTPRTMKPTNAEAMPIIRRYRSISGVLVFLGDQRGRGDEQQPQGIHHHQRATDGDGDIRVDHRYL